MKKSHVFNPKHVDVLEEEARKTWQNPEEILNTVDLKPNFVAVDLGCGSGFFTVPLSQKVHKVYAIDVQEKMLEFLRKKIRKLKITNVEPLLSKSKEIPLGDESVDFLVSVNTLHEFDDRETVIEEIKRVLKRGGMVLIVDFKKEDTGFGPSVSVRVSKKQAKNLFEKKGFTTLKTQELMYHYLLVFSKENSHLSCLWRKEVVQIRLGFQGKLFSKLLTYSKDKDKKL
jgi:ubiquinone/menaquinone biosynthesis C-methylase UbiE